LFRYEILLRDEKQIPTVVRLLKNMDVGEVRVHPFAENVIHVIFKTSNEINLSAIMNSVDISRVWINKDGRIETITSEIEFYFE
jgi:hypothetical protein